MSYLLGGGRFELVPDEEHRLGAGGMAVVYAAQDLWRGGAQVAIKLMAPSLRGDEAQCHRFAREQHVTCAVQGCPHVVQYVACGEDRELGPWLAMVPVAGVTLAELLKRNGPLAPGPALDLLGQLAEGLDGVHAAGVVHRDVKPENAIVDAAGSLMLTDFGIAIHARPDDRVTPAGQFLGTPAYAAPEQSRGEAVGPSADIYSLSVVAYELLTGQLPPAARPGRRRADVLREAAGPSCRLPQALFEAIAVGLSEHPADRYGWAQELVAAARAAFAGDTVPEPAPGIWAVPAGDTRRPHHAHELDEVVRTLRRWVSVTWDFVLTYSRSAAIVVGLLVTIYVVARLGLLTIETAAAVVRLTVSATPWPEIGAAVLLAGVLLRRAAWRPSAGTWRAVARVASAAVPAALAIALLAVGGWRVAPHAIGWGRSAYRAARSLPAAAQALAAAALLTLAASRWAPAAGAMRQAAQAAAPIVRRAPRVLMRAVLLSPLLLLGLPFADSLDLHRASHLEGKWVLAIPTVLVLVGLAAVLRRVRPSQLVVPLGVAAIVAMLAIGLVAAPQAVRETVPGVVSLTPPVLPGTWPAHRHPPATKRRKPARVVHQTPHRHAPPPASSRPVAPPSGTAVAAAPTRTPQAVAPPRAASRPAKKPCVCPPREPAPSKSPAPPTALAGKPTPEPQASYTHSHSVQRSCVNGACTTTVCDDGHCTTTHTGGGSGGALPPGSSSRGSSTVCDATGCHTVTTVCDATGCHSSG